MYALNPKLGKQIGGILGSHQILAPADLTQRPGGDGVRTLTSKGRAFSAATRTNIMRMALETDRPKASSTWAASFLTRSSILARTVVSVAIVLYIVATNGKNRKNCARLAGPPLESGKIDPVR